MQYDETDYELIHVPVTGQSRANLLNWLPKHQKKAAKAKNKLMQNGSLSSAWRKLYHYHNDMAMRMENNLLID